MGSDSDQHYGLVTFVFSLMIAASVFKSGPLGCNEEEFSQLNSGDKWWLK